MIDGIVAWLGQQMQTGLFASGAALGLAGAAAATVHRLLPWALQLIRAATTTSVIVDSRSDVFEPLLLWLHHHPYSTRCRRLTATLRSAGDHGDGDGKKELVFTPAPGSHLLRYRGCPIWLERRRLQKGDGESLLRGSTPSETLHLTALGRDRGLLRRLIEEAVARYGQPDPETTAIYGLGEYLEWERLARIRRRPLESVILPEGVVEGLLADASRFLAGATWYVERGIPWRRGYLLYGPPGTGKTSLVKALAGALDLDVAVINLASPKLDDAVLCRLFAEAPAHSVLLMEDVDSAFCQREHDDANGRVTFSGLLNAIDGVMSQEGHLLFMTTNHLDRLDPALIRPGRVDVRVETGAVNREMAKRMFLAFFPGEVALVDIFADALGANQVTMAYLQGHLLRHRDSAPDAARTALSLK
ncbi:MAG: AAA family ATPase [Azospirillaceae bacterium]|nr:AAA family ATPase [Azospirillaceae bacterium]